MPAQQETGEGVHKACGWPPPDGADDDGYMRINVRGYANGEAQVDDDANAWRFTSSCKRMQIEWADVKSGVRARDIEPGIYTSGPTLTMGGEPTSLKEARHLEGELTAKDLVIVATGGVTPGNTVCV